MLPFSTEWFMTWQPNIHSSLFYGIYRFIGQHGGCEPIQSIVKGYRLYLEHNELHGEEPILSLTRAWTLVRFFDSGMLQTNTCSRCGGHFRRACLRLAAGFHLRPVPAAVARGQDAQGERCALGALR